MDTKKSLIYSLMIPGISLVSFVLILGIISQDKKVKPGKLW